MARRGQRRGIVRAALATALALFASGVTAQSNNQCDLPGEAPDLIAGGLETPMRYGASGGITAYSIGTTACNLGTCWANWIDNTEQHPVIGQSLYRLKDGRFEQIGQSWLKHSFSAFQLTYCSSSCMSAGTSTRLGVNCSDPYSASLNGTQESLGPKDEVNAFTGSFPYPPRDHRDTGDVIYKRLQVHNVDLDPAQNAGAQYYVEGQYVAADDALGGNGGNNASYRRVVITGPVGTYNLSYLGVTFAQTPAISAWYEADASVTQTRATVPGEGIFDVAAKATDLGDGYWHYEYAVHNLNSHRSGGSFVVPLPVGAQIRNIGFHDVDYHSGETVVGTDWAAVVESDPPAIAWHTEDYAANGNANALRWGTLYNFRFDADVAPVSGPVTIGLWRPGSPSSIDVTTVVPRVCDGDAVCDVGETCTRCPLECGAPGPGGDCCGNGTCQPTGESRCSCASDCGPPTVTEVGCGNSQDDDCDGLTDCADPECCSDGGCLAADGDGDAHPAACDCDDENMQAWATPGESTALTLAKGASGEAVLTWSPPAASGSTSVQYEILRAPAPSNFTTSTVCLSGPNPNLPELTDPQNPTAFQRFFFYLIRATNTCPNGEGPLGLDSSGQPRSGRSCP